MTHISYWHSRYSSTPLSPTSVSSSNWMYKPPSTKNSDLARKRSRVCLRLLICTTFSGMFSKCSRPSKSLRNPQILIKAPSIQELIPLLVESCSCFVFHLFESHIGCQICNMLLLGSGWVLDSRLMRTQNSLAI